MLKSKPVFAAILALFLSACTGGLTTRSAPLEELPDLIVGIKSTRSATWHVEDVRVHVPDSLTVSEANLYLPNADIVWREDRHGDRRRQVSDIVDLAVSQAVLGLNGSSPVYLDVTLKRFHALSQKARATVGGMHTIVFDVAIHDSSTNLALVEPFEVDVNLKAFGGQKAIDAELRGQTQKARITQAITSIMRQHLGT